MMPLRVRLYRGNPADEEMHEENLANRLDRVLAERLREFPAGHPMSLREAVRRPIRWIRDRSGIRPVTRPSASCQEETIARIRCLPAHIQEALRRYFVFREAEESIAFSLQSTPADFRRFLRDAAGYTLQRHDRMPNLEQKRQPGSLTL
jgi:hypothetical protein